MINNWKLGYKSLKYAYGRKSNLFVMGIYALFGLMVFAMEFMSRELYFRGLDSYMFMCAAMMPTQMLSSLSMSNLIQSSPARKKMQTAVMAVFTCGNMIVAYLVSVLFRGLAVIIRPETAGVMGISFLMTGITMAIMMAYLAIAYKYFVASVVMFIFVYFSLYTRAGMLYLMETRINLPLMAGAALGLLLVAAGGFVQYALSLMVYKTPMSKMAQSATLRKEL